MAEVYIQLGLYGVNTAMDDAHVVSAHLRLLPGGGTTFVAEHMRWNRPGKPKPPLRPRPAPVPDGQQALFPRSEPEAEPDEFDAGWGYIAEQLCLW